MNKYEIKTSFTNTNATNIPPSNSAADIAMQIHPLGKPFALTTLPIHHGNGHPEQLMLLQKAVIKKRLYSQEVKF